MLRLLPGTLCIIVTHLILAAAFIGIGLHVRRSSGLTRVTIDDTFTAFWMGFAAIILLLILWNFALPVGATALTVVLLAGATGLWRSRRELIEIARDPRSRPPAWALVALALVALWVGNNSISGVWSSDSALYHMPGVEWAHRYPAPPGLANLFGPLGFNNSIFLYDAMLNAGPWKGRAHHVANGLFVVVFLAQCTMASVKLTRGEDSERPAGLFLFVMIAAALVTIQDDRAASYVTDVAACLVLLALSACWYATQVQPPDDAREDAYRFVCIVALAALAVCLKMNATIFSAMMVTTAGLLWLRRAPVGRLRRTTLAWAAAVAVAFGAAWMGRGVVLSGYPLFPSRLLAAPVAWRVPAEHAQAEFDYIVHSARGSVENIEVIAGHTGLWGWMPRWIEHLQDQPYVLPVPLLLALITIPAAWWLRRGASGATRAASVPAWWLVLPAAVALAAWFKVSPSPRYAGSFFWALAALGAGQALLLAGPRAAPATRRRMLVAGWLLGASPLIMSPVLHWWQRGRVDSVADWIIKENLVIPAPGTWFNANRSEPKTTPYTTTSGLIVQVPERYCWAAPPPCTPNPAPNLRLRVAGRLDRGFMVDGPWQMINWPEKWRPRFLPAWREGRRAGGAATSP